VLPRRPRSARWTVAALAREASALAREGSVLAGGVAGAAGQTGAMSAPPARTATEPAAPAVRPAVPEDAAGILALICELAAFEREPDAVRATAADVAAALAGEHPVASALVAADATGTVVGMALWFRTFSTWTGQAGMWLEDLYVRPDHRRTGTGRRLLRELAARCVAEGWARLEWTVLDWNTEAQAFYQAVGAIPMSDWTTNRVSGPALAALAGSAP